MPRIVVPLRLSPSLGGLVVLGMNAINLRNKTPLEELGGTATTAELVSEIPDVAVASIRFHVKELEEASYLIADLPPDSSRKGKTVAWTLDVKRVCADADNLKRSIQPISPARRSAT